MTLKLSNQARHHTMTIALLPVIAVMAAASAGLAWWLDPALSDPIRFDLLWRNALPWFLIMLLFLGLSGRALFAMVLASVLTVAAYQINGIKELNLDVPLLPGDLVLWQQLMGNADFFATYTGHHLWWLVVACVALVVLLGGAWWLDGRRRHQGAITRIAVTALVMLSLVTLYRGEGPWRMTYARTTLPDMRLWDAMRSVQDVGFAAFFIRSLQEMHASAAPPVAVEAVTGFAREHAQLLDARRNRPVPAELPDIVMIQSEAFFDPARLNGIESGEYLANFRALAATGIHGDLRVTAYGGGTIRTEFETLTGYPMAAFPAVAYPYYGLAAGWMPSLPQRLAALGYSTALYHPFRGDFWNRRQVMPQLGFGESHYQEAFTTSERAGPFVSDRALFQRLGEALDVDSTAPQFIMGITMENHGPWNADLGVLGAQLQGHALPPGLSTAGARELAYYLAHLVNGDAALGDFARSLLARSRWTVLVFYGDHLPNLADAFADLGFDDDGTAISQPTRYLLLSNRTLTPRELDIDAFQLPGLLLDTLQLPLDGYLAIGAAERELAPAGAASAGPDRLEHDAARAEVACGRVLDAEGLCH